MSYPAGPPDPYDSPTGQAAAQYPPPEPSGNAADDFIIAALVAAIIAGWVLSKIRDLLTKAQDVDPETVTFLLRQTVFVQLLKMDEYAPTNPMLGAQRRQNAFRRAAYVVNAARRMTTAVRTRDPATITAAWDRELNYLGSHLQANHKRNEAAIQLAKRWQRAGRPALMGWWAKRDNRTSKECLAAHGRNFDPKSIPPIGYPGSVHPNCRCKPVLPWDTDLRVENLPDARMMFDGVVAATRPDWTVATTEQS